MEGRNAMESRARSIAKAISWQGLGLLVTLLLGWLFFGSWRVAGAFALTGQAIALVAYFLHERLWARIGWGRQSAPGAQAAPIASPASARSIRATVSSTPYSAMKVPMRGP